MLEGGQPGFSSSPRPSPHEVQSGSKGPRGRAGTHLLFLILLAVRAGLCGESPGVVHVQREGQGPSLGLFQLPKQSLGSSRVRAQRRARKGQGTPPSLDLTSSSHSLCCFFLAMSRAVSPSSFTVRGQVRSLSQGQSRLIA